MYKSQIKFSFLLFLFSLGLQGQSLKLASDIWPPFTDTEHKQSIAIDIVSEALHRIQIKNTTSIVDFQHVIEGIKSNKYDGSAAFWKTKGREKSMIFSAPYLENQLVLVGKQGADINFSSNARLQYKKLGLVAGYSYDEKLLNDPMIDIVFSKNDQQNLEKLLSNEIDYFLVDNLLIQYMLNVQLNDVKKYLSISDKPFATKTLHLAINKDVDNAENIIQEFDKQIKLMMKNGTYNKIMQLDWIEVDINNDGISELVFNGDASNSSLPKRSYALFFNDTETAGFYINNVHYKDWESVPEQYKNNIPKQSNELPRPIGLHITL